MSVFPLASVLSDSRWAAEELAKDGVVVAHRQLGIGGYEVAGPTTLPSAVDLRWKGDEHPGHDVALIGHTRLGEGGEMARLAATPSRKRLVPRAALVALIALLGLLVAAPADAQRARHVTINVEDTFVNDFWTETCGTTVVVSVEGTLHVTLLYNEAGLIEKEIDPSSGLTWTFTAPLTGNSFSYPANTAIFDYGAGAEVGSTFTAKFVGLGGHVPGVIASDAGLVIVAGGVVEGFDEFGIPLIDFETAELVVEHGNFQSFEDVAAAICGTLTA